MSPEYISSRSQGSIILLSDMKAELSIMRCLSAITIRPKDEMLIVSFHCLTMARKEFTYEKDNTHDRICGR